MDIQLTISFLVASIILTIMPGPDNLYVMAHSIANGAREGIVISSGLISGIVIHTLIAATGLGILFLQSESTIMLVKYLGVIYLWYLAFLAWRDRENPISFDNERSHSSTKQFSLWKTGFLMNILNPKVTIFFIAFLPQFVARDGFHPSIQMIILGILFMIQGIVVFMLIAKLAGKLRDILSQADFQKKTQILKVMVLVFLGISLLCFS